jgi:hypothetical protein
MTVTTIFIVLALLQIKHQIIDWMWQPPYEFMNKGTYGHFGGIRHAGKNAIGTGFVFWIVGVDPVTALLLALADFIIHYHIDFSKMNLNRIWKLTPEKPYFWWLTGFDQTLHQLTYLGLVWWVA